MMTGRAWFPGSELAGVVTAMITYKGRARALTRQSPVRHLVPRHPKDFADSLVANPENVHPSSRSDANLLLAVICVPSGSIPGWLLF